MSYLLHWKLSNSSQFSFSPFKVCATPLSTYNFMLLSEKKDALKEIPVIWQSGLYFVFFVSLKWICGVPVQVPWTPKYHGPVFPTNHFRRKLAQYIRTLVSIDFVFVNYLFIYVYMSSNKFVKVNHFDWFLCKCDVISTYR